MYYSGPVFVWNIAKRRERHMHMYVCVGVGGRGRCVGGGERPRVCMYAVSHAAS